MPFRVLGSVFVFLFLFFPGLACAEEAITSFVVHIELKENGSALVQEEIVYDLGGKDGHGILRKIPLMFHFPESSDLIRTEISSIHVTNGYGVPVDTQYDKGGNMATLRIGNPDVVVTGPQLYVIRYTIWGAITARLTSDVFTWNITGNDWQVPIERLRADVVLPRVLTPERVSMRCGAGEGTPVGSCTSTSTMTSATGTIQAFRFEQDVLAKHEALNIEVIIPKGEFLFTTAHRKVERTPSKEIALRRWWREPFIDLSLSFPFFVFAGLYTAWLSEGKKRRKKYNNHQKSQNGVMMSMRVAYLFSASVLLGCSFFVPTYNLGCFLSGIVILVFGYLYRR